ncbi:RAD17 [Blepharisma stoltei]|uniref:Uncharacterized protein n=1 Tax=Blepharisma stoltei TaxID=1481888 RepID=A0AAU9IQM4_9CILI|nr:unnamed protein product [Blepharisma stoltei]
MAKSLKRKRKDISKENSVEIDQMLESLAMEDLAVGPKKLNELQSVFENFINLGKALILVLLGPYGCGKTASAVCCAKNYNLTYTFWKPQDLMQAESDELYSVSYLNQLINFLNFQSSTKKALKIPGCAPKEINNVLIIDSLPTFYNDKQKEDFQMCINKCLKGLSKLIIFIMSDYSPNQIPQIFSIEASQFIKVIQFREVGKRPMVKALKRANIEWDIKNPDYEEIEEISNGNLRTALNKLLLLKLSSGRTQNVSNINEEESSKFGFFHSLGKFMYNKRIDFAGQSKCMTYAELWDREHRPKLSFDPDDVINHSPCDPSIFWLYLMENCICFYEDIDDLAECYESFQLADLLQTTHADAAGTFSELMPAHLAGRAVVDSNLHPAKTGFFNFKKPGIWRLIKGIPESQLNIKKQQENEIIASGFRLNEFLVDVWGFNRGSLFHRKFEEDIEEEKTTQYWENLSNSLENIKM